MSLSARLSYDESYDESTFRSLGAEQRNSINLDPCSTADSLFVDAMTRAIVGAQKSGFRRVQSWQIERNRGAHPADQRSLSDFPTLRTTRRQVGSEEDHVLIKRYYRYQLCYILKSET